MGSAYYGGRQPIWAWIHPIRMRALATIRTARIKGLASYARVCAILLFSLLSIARARAAATLLLEEPYSYDGAFAGTGHSAVYLSRVCSVSPVVLRLCDAGESGVVLSRYDGIAGYDWIAIPLTSYLYAVDKPEDIPLVADAKLVAFLRDRYRREHLSALAPDRPDGGIPEGNWYELVGASYDRTIYGFEIETSPEQDALLIGKFNSQPNQERYNFMKRNCADFVREIIDFYYPHALHRSVVGDLGVTTPKQIAKMMAKYSRHHPELHSSAFLVAQVPGPVRRSKPVHGVVESVVAAKKYMLPVVVLHPYIGGGLLVGYLGHHFDPSRNALVADSSWQLDAPLTHQERLTYENRLNEMTQSTAPETRQKRAKKSKAKSNDLKTWERLLANAEPGLDASGQPILQVHEGDTWMNVGLTRANILGSSESSDLAANFLEARLRQELRPAGARKTSRANIDADLALLRQALSQTRNQVAFTTSPTKASRESAKTSIQ